MVFFILTISGDFGFNLRFLFWLSLSSVCLFMHHSPLPGSKIKDLQGDGCSEFQAKHGLPVWNRTNLKGAAM